MLTREMQEFKIIISFDRSAKSDEEYQGREGIEITAKHYG